MPSAATTQVKGESHGSWYWGEYAMILGYPKFGAVTMEKEEKCVNHPSKEGGLIAAGTGKKNKP